MISGAMSNTYTFATNGSTVTGAWSFELQVSDAASVPVSVNSSACSVTVNPALVAPTASGPSAVDQGQTISLNSTLASGGMPSYTYQWLSMAPGAASYTAIPGATSTIYNIITSSSTTLGNWNYVIQVTDAAGANANSTALTIAINPVLQAPAVTPSSPLISQGQSATLTAASMTTGSAPFSYQWFIKEAFQGSYSAVGTNSPSYTFVTSTATDTGSWSFKVQVTDATGVSVNSTDTSIQVYLAPATPTPTPVPTPTPHPSPTPTPTAKPSASPTPIESPTSSPTVTPTASQSPSAGTSVTTYVIVGVVVALIAAGAIVAFMMMRKKQKP